MARGRITRENACEIGKLGGRPRGSIHPAVPRSDGGGQGSQVAPGCHGRVPGAASTSSGKYFPPPPGKQPCGNPLSDMTVARITNENALLTARSLKAFSRSRPRPLVGRASDPQSVAPGAQARRAKRPRAAPCAGRAPLGLATASPGAR